MYPSVPGAPDRRQRDGRAGLPVTVTGVLVALCCVGFAMVNVVFEVTDHFAGGRYAQYVTGISVMDWLVVALKLIGAVVAVLSIANRSWPVGSTVLSVFVWGAFATLGVYALGALTEAVGMASGLGGNADQIDAWGVAYVLFFLAFAAGFGVLAISHLRRHRVRPRFAVVGVLGAPAVLGLILLAVPTLLATDGLLPAH